MLKLNKWHRLGLFILALSLVCSSIAYIKSENETTIDDIHFVGLLMGDKIFTEDLQNHVVVILFFRMMDSYQEDMRKMVELHKKYSSKGLILAALYPGVRSEKVIEFCKSMNVPFPIYQTWDRSTPCLIVFDHKGKIIFNGSPSMGYGKVDTAMQSAPDPLIGEGPYKKLDALAQKARERKDLGQLLSTLRTKYLNSEDADEKSEAVKLVEGISRFGNKLIEQAGKNKETEPLITYNLYQEVKLLFKGDEIGNNAEKILKELEKDKNFQDNLKADKELADIMPQIQELNGCKKHSLYNKQCGPCQKRNPALPKLLKTAQGLIDRHPSSPAAAKIKELLPL